DQLSPALIDRKTLREFQARILSPCAATEIPVRPSYNPLQLLTSTQFSPPSVERKMPSEALAKNAFPLSMILYENLLVRPSPILVQLRPLSVERSRTAERLDPSPSALM